jgi:Ser-tRNA(Ala) deacylase AlaX
MRLHSAAHLSQCFMERVLGVSLEHPNFSDLQEDRGINRYDRPHLLSNEQLSDAVQLLNEFTAAEHSIRIYPDIGPGKPDWARLWQCEGWKIPCGGVHPASTKEIGPIAADVSVRKHQTAVTFRLAS